MIARIKDLLALLVGAVTLAFSFFLWAFAVLIGEFLGMVYELGSRFWAWWQR